MAENEDKVTIRGIRRAGMRLLGESDNAAVRDTPLLDVDCLLQYVLKKDRSWLLAYDDTVLSDEQVEQMGQLLKKRQTGLPIAYLTGEKEFYGYSFFVTPAVLIPKPDTEILVERAVEIIAKRLTDIVDPSTGSGILHCESEGILRCGADENLRCGAEKGLSGEPEIVTVVDMCTGSGCIAISVLLQLYERFGASVLCSRLKLYATDISSDALDVARENARRLLPADIACCLQFCQGNLWDAVPSPAEIAAPSTALREPASLVRDPALPVRDPVPLVRDPLTAIQVLLTNPPYVPAEVTTRLLTDGRNEPRLALDGGNDGLDLVRIILEQAPAHMAPGGVMLLETGEYNAEEAATLAETAGFTNVHIHKDLAGMLRLTEAAFPE